MQDTLCNNHNEIIHNLNIIKQALKNCGAEQAYIDLVVNTKRQCKHCKKLGLRMEARLQKYRSAIENLDFVRVYKNK